MIVYGDPQFTVTAGAFISDLRQQLRETRPESLDELRSLLIRVGQLEQGIVDLLEREPLVHPETIQAATDFAAVAFCSAFSAKDRSIATKALRELDASLDPAPRRSGPTWRQFLTTSLDRGIGHDRPP